MLVDGAAPYYEWMGAVMSLGSEHYYRQSGFVDVERRVMAGLLSEYTGTRPR